MEEVGPLNLSKEAVVVMVVDVVEECHNSNNMVAPLNIMAGEGEDHLSKEVVEDIVVVVPVSAVAVEEDLLLVAHPDHQFPSCTKQPWLHIKLR